MWDARRPTSSSESPMTGSNTGTLSPPRSPGSKEDNRVPRNTASARVIFTSSASRPLGGNSRILRWTSHRRRGSTSCDSRAAAIVIRQPRFIPIQAATMPSRSLTTARPRPWLPSGSPPGPGQISWNTKARFWRTSTWISISGWERFTRTPGWARRTTSPSSRARSWLVNGWVPTRRVRSANVFPAARDHFASERTTCRSDARSAWVSAAGLIDTTPNTRVRMDRARATSSVINHHRRGLVDFRLGGVLLAGALLGAVVGTVFTLKVLNQETFEAFFAAVLIAFGVYMVRDWTKNARSVDEDVDSAMTPPRVAATAAATTGSGFLSGSMGIGGGLLNVPLLVYVLGRKTRKAIGTSSLLIIPTAAVGFVAYVVDLALRPGGFAWPAEFVLIPILMPVVFVGA